MVGVSVRWPLVAMVLIGLGGCSSEPTTLESSFHAPLAQPLSERSSRVTIESVPLGRVPWDGASLPVVSPDAKMIATVKGRAPSRAVLTASPGQRPPDECAIELFQLSAFSDKGHSIGMVPVAAVLGRSSNADGFLIENIQPDGSRWIGQYPWTGGKVAWLVTDERVNAFAAMGPDGAIAWSSRRIDRREFDLIVSTADGEWTSAPESDDLDEPYVPPLLGVPVIVGERPGRASWMFPTFGLSNRDLMCFRLQDGRLDAVWLELGDDRMRIRATLPLASQANEFLAWQCAATVEASPVSVDGQFMFIHPEKRCLVLWNPRDGQVTELGPNVILAAPVGDGGYVINDGKTLAYREPLGSRRKLATGLLMPRRVLSDGREIVVANPRGSDQIEFNVVQVRPAPTTASAETPAAVGQ